MLGERQARAVMLAAADVTAIESRFKKRWQAALEAVTMEILENAAETGRLAFSGKTESFNSIVMEHALATMRVALDHSVDFMPRVPTTRLAQPPGPPPKARVPTSFRQLRIMWDMFRKKKYIPPRQMALAERIRREYLKKVQDVWVTYGEEFRRGDIAHRRDAVSAIMKGADVAYSRAKMIVETETTYYYNKTRKAVFDESPDVSHYLFMAIRDHRTTEWCKTRHGLVYAKDDPLLQAERPPCFTGDTPVLTIEGWKDISTVTVGELVWTHENRWRRIEKIHSKNEKLEYLFQIGFGLATPNHPYIERSAGIVEAEFFKPEEGIWAGSLNLRQMFKAGLDAMVQKRPKILFHSMSRYLLGTYSNGSEIKELERWQEKIKRRLHRNNDAGSSESQQTGIRDGAYIYHGETDSETACARGSGSSYKSGQNRQSYRKSSINDKQGPSNTSCKIRWKTSAGNDKGTQTQEKQIVEVWNIEVEEDHTFFAGGYLVHNCHWNCRSEILPLTRQNPRHLKLIEDPARQRRNHKCKPLPPEWNGR